MSDDKLTEIRARHLLDAREVPPRFWNQEHNDRGTLLAEVDRRGAEIERLRAAVRWYADPSNHFRVERRNPGDPDPAVVFVEEPPIMLDGGERARRALEGKP